jgi:hypothetical protein
VKSSTETGKLYSELRVKLPAFAADILRQRAREGGESVSAVVESLVLEGVMVDELRAVMERSPELAASVEAWFRFAVARRK